MPKRDRAKLTKVSTSLPFGIGKFEWEADPAERRAAWALYVELVTRIGIQPLDAESGLLREALSSLQGLFPTTRQILKEAGPEVGASPNSVGGIAIAVLNKGLRPFLSKWHPSLQTWEAQRKAEISPVEHEKGWLEATKLRNELAMLNKNLEEYAKALASIAGVKDTIDDSQMITTD